MNVGWIRAALIGISALVVSGCGGGHSATASGQAESRPVEMAPLVTRVEGYQPPAPVVGQQIIATPRRGERPAAFQVKVPPETAGRRAEPNRPAGRFGVPAQVGSARDVPATSDATGMARVLKWQRGANHSVAAVSFASEGAAGLRIGLLIRKLPADALVRGYVQGADTAFEIPGSAILAAIQRNRDAGEMGDAGRTYWTPPVDGQEVTLEIELPPGTPTDAVDISVPRLSHLQFKSDDIATAKIGQSQSCEVDVSCVSDAGALSAATARMLFTDAGISYLCTGTLVNDASSSGTPYFLSANHCISTQATASSLTTYWFYRSTACNSGVLNGGYRTLFSGAALLYASSATDTSFMRLNEPAPPGALFAGWTVDAPALGADVVGVHHPLGDLQKFNRGTLSGFGSCSSGSLDTFSCVNATPVTGMFLFSKWNVGTTEAGSSGSGLFAAVGASRYLIGQLYGGSASCTFLNGSDSYGRFDTAYFAALSRWLSLPATTPRTAVYRFYNAGTGAHFFTSSAAERDWVISVNPSFRFEGVAFYAYGSQISGASPVFRFYNTRNGRHFFTISPVERDIVLSILPDFSYEGIGWYAQAGSGGTAAAVYRFYNDSLATHFYTISEGERDWVLANLPGYRLEGVGYYAWTTQ